MTLAEFLRWEDGTDTRYELLAGVPVAMAPPAIAHGIFAAARRSYRRGASVTSSEFWSERGGDRQAGPGRHLLCRRPRGELFPARTRSAVASGSAADRRNLVAGNRDVRSANQSRGLPPHPERRGNPPYRLGEHL